MAEVNATEPTRQSTCPYCLAEIPPAARKCQHCGEWLETHISVGGNRTARDAEKPSVGVTAGIGVVLSVIGVMGLIFAMNLDTSVPAGPFGLDRVQNLGLLSEKQNWVLVTSVCAALGVLLVALGVAKQRRG